MTASRYPQLAGKRFESELTSVMREDGWDVERLRLAGVEDEGDILLRTGAGRYVIEAKREKGFSLAGWVKEARVERDNYAAHRSLDASNVGFVVVHYARSKGLRQSYVTTTLEEWLSRVPM